MKKIGIIGPSRKNCTEAQYEFGVELGERIATKDRTLVCGGMGGFMEAVFKGAKQSAGTFGGQTIGILPGDNPKSANPYVDTAIPTGVGIARNIIIVRTADIVIATGGGSGTLSEIAFAWQLKKTVLCVTQFDGWAKELAGRNLDNRHRDLLIPVNGIAEIVDYLKDFESEGLS